MKYQGHCRYEKWMILTLFRHHSSTNIKSHRERKITIGSIALAWAAPQLRERAGRTGWRNYVGRCGRRVCSHRQASLFCGGAGGRTHLWGVRRSLQSRVRWPRPWLWLRRHRELDLHTVLPWHGVPHVEYRAAAKVCAPFRGFYEYKSCIFRLERCLDIIYYKDLTA